MYPFAPTIVVIDFDWSYQCWLVGVLAAAGFRVFPVRSAADADALIRSSKVSVALMIVDPRLSGVAELVRTLRERQGRLRVIASVEHGSDPGPLDVVAVLDKPRTAAERDTLAPIWLAAIKSIVG